MASKANTYRAVLIGLAIIIIAFVGYFIYRAIVGTKKIVQTTTITSPLSPSGAGQSIRENAPVSNTPNSSSGGIVPVTGSGTGNGNGLGGSTSSGNGVNHGTVPSGTDTANYGPPPGSPCNALDAQDDPVCQAQQVPPSATGIK